MGKQLTALTVLVPDKPYCECFRCRIKSLCCGKRA